MAIATPWKGVPRKGPVGSSPTSSAFIFKMNIISWNVNGIRAVHKKNLFVPFLEEYKPDIICLQEVKAQEHESLLDLQGYTQYWNPATKKGYSGTAIFTRIKPLSVALNFPKPILEKYNLEKDVYGNPNEEGRITVLEFKDFYVASVYTPNAKDDLSRIPLRHKVWDPAFLEYMTYLNKNKPVIFCGDLNVAHTENDLANPKSNNGKKGFTKEEREGIDNIIKNGFLDTFRIFNQGNGHYTWWSHFANSRARNVGWRIDYIFASESLRPKISQSLICPQVFGSDHCPIKIDIDL